MPNPAKAYRAYAKNPHPLDAIICVFITNNLLYKIGT
jgi:hypothetical protein